MNKIIMSLDEIIAMDSVRYENETKSAMRRELRQRMRTCETLKSLFDNVNVAVEINQGGTVNNGSFYESVIKALLTMNSMNYYTSSSRTHVDLSNSLVAKNAEIFNLNNSCNYEVKTSMCNESNELTQDDNVIVVNFKGVMLLNKSDIESLTENDFRKNTRRLKNSVEKGIHLELLENLLGF